MLASVKPEEIIDNDGNVVYEGTKNCGAIVWTITGLTEAEVGGDVVLYS